MVRNLEELHQLYIRFTDQQNERYKQQGIPVTGRQDFTRWLVNRKICPHGIITPNSRYWFETIVICDNESSLNLPMGLLRTPDIFFQALGIVRKERTEAEKEQRGRAQNSNSN